MAAVESPNAQSPKVSCESYDDSFAPSGPAQAPTPSEDRRRWSLPKDQDGGTASSQPSLQDMERMEFEVAMLLRHEISSDEGLEHTINESKSLIHVVDCLEMRENVLDVLQSPGTQPGGEHAQVQAHAAICLGITRLRQFLRIKIADSEDLKCARKALVEMIAFFDEIDRLLAIEPICGTSRFDIVLRLRHIQ